MTIESHKVPGMTDDMAPVFRALADPGRRVLLDQLFERDGQTLGELCAHLPAMTRFGVMKHLGVLEEAGLVTTQRVGREKRHFLNPVPIRLVHDRWTGKFAESIVGSLKTIKAQLETPPMGTDQPRLQHLHQGIARPRLAGDHRRRRHRPLLLRDAGRVRLGDGLAADLYLSRTAASRPTGRCWTSSPGESVDDVVPPALEPGDRCRGSGPDDLGRRADPRTAASKLTVTSALVPGSTIEGEFSGGVVYIVSGLKTFVETGEPLAVA